MRTNEQERNIPFKSTGVSLFFEHGSTDAVCSKLYLINLIDSPDQVDSSLEATVDYRDTDGVRVDFIEGCAVKSETALRQALR